MKLLPVLLGVIASQAIVSGAAEQLLREPDFWSPKTIYISIMVPGSSLTTWVLEIGQVLAARGHNVTFLCRSYSEKYLKDYPGIKYANLVDNSILYDDDEFNSVLRQRDDNIGFMKMIIKAAKSSFRDDYTQYSAHFQAQRPDIVLCDHLNDPCIRAADENKIPLIETSTIVPFQAWSLWNVCKEATRAMQELGISSAKQPVPIKTLDSVKLINNFFGLEPARRVGPLIRFTSPILSASYPPMDDNTAQFLNSHNKVTYVAFGHQSIATTEEFSQLLRSLIDSVEAGTSDGFFWVATKVTDFPENVNSSLGTKQDVKEMIRNGSKHPHYKFSKWAPQYAILSHPPTEPTQFESLYLGKKMLLHPYFGDQPYNAKMMHSAGVGLEYNRHLLSHSDITDKVQEIVRDKDGYFERNVNRMSALVQLKAKEAIPNIVSTVEEVILSSHGDKVPHLYQASRNMSYIKANNIDINFLLVAIAGFIALASYKILLSFYSYYYIINKVKTY
ncbi:hypothetical protein Unana1_05441 [Umbelopsis nana]